jgi:hypothetical protein
MNPDIPMDTAVPPQSLAKHWRTTNAKSKTTKMKDGRAFGATVAFLQQLSLGVFDFEFLFYFVDQRVDGKINTMQPERAARCVTFFAFSVQARLADHYDNGFKFHGLLLDDAAGDSGDDCDRARERNEYQEVNGEGHTARPVEWLDAGGLPARELFVSNNADAQVARPYRCNQEEIMKTAIEIIKAQYDALNRLLEMVMTLDPKFSPSKSAVWPVMVRAHKFIKEKNEEAGSEQ